MKNIYRTIVAIIKFILFWLWVAVQIPIALILWPFPRRASIWHFKWFMRSVLIVFTGIRVRVVGQISSLRPLLIVSNHVSDFEFMTFPSTFGGAFFAKDDIRHYPVVGWFTKRWGSVFISRKPTDAPKMVQLIESQLKSADWPMVIYPEGTTTNGSVILPFKSSMFDFIERGTKIAVQPMVIFYRYRDGTPIDDQTLANDYAYFWNHMMPDGAARCRVERSAFGQVFHIFKIGGFMTEFHLLPVVDLAGLTRKEIAIKLHDLMCDKFYKYKDKK